MLDNKPLELRAKFCIANKLMKLELLVSDPLFDVQGSDLIVIKKIDSSVKLGVVQSKGRSIKDNKSSNVRIHEAYLKENFIVFLYIEKEGSPKEYLYCFFSEDVQKWSYRDNNFTLTIPFDFDKKQTFVNYEFDLKASVKLLKIFDESSFDYFDEYSKILLIEKAVLLWEDDNIIPSLDLLREVFYGTDFRKTNLNQDILMYYSALIRTEDLEMQANEFPEDLSYEFLLDKIERSANTDKPIITDSNLVKTKMLQSQGSSFYTLYNRQITAEIVIRIDEELVDGIWCITMSSAGKGIEMFAPRKRGYQGKVRYYNENVEIREREAFQLIIQKHYT